PQVPVGGGVHVLDLRRRRRDAEAEVAAPRVADERTKRSEIELRTAAATAVAATARCYQDQSEVTRHAHILPAPRRASLCRIAPTAYAGSGADLSGTSRGRGLGR